METKELEILRKLLKQLNKIDSINSGGCGIAALAIYRFLEKHNLINNTKIIYLYAYDDASIYYNNIHNQKNNSILDAPAHVILKHENSYIDSRGIKDRIICNWKEYKQELNVKELLISVKKSDWNPFFNKRDSIPLIEKIFDIDLSDVNTY